MVRFRLSGPCGSGGASEWNVGYGRSWSSGRGWDALLGFWGITCTGGGLVWRTSLPAGLVVGLVWWVSRVVVENCTVDMSIFVDFL